MSNPSPTPLDDRNLLFCLFALQMGRVQRDELLAAMDAWAADQAKPLGQLLVERGSLSVEARGALDAMVAEHLEQQPHDPARRLAALKSIGTMLSGLDPDVQFEVRATMAHVSTSKAVSAVDVAGPGAAEIGVVSVGGRRFQIVRLHDRGGLGEVYIARDRELKRDVALKQIKDEHADDEQRRARFLVEAEITGGLEHPGIVPVYSLGQYENGRPYYAMRFIRGHSLKEAIERFHRGGSPSPQPSPTRGEGAEGKPPAPFPPPVEGRIKVGGKSTPLAAHATPLAEKNLQLRKLLRRFLDVCNAVEYAHSRGVVHRDLKPANIMLGPFGETLVVDWGLAKSLSQPEVAAPIEAAGHESAGLSGSDVQPTVMGSRVGTPPYMSPEQAAGRLDQLGPASDVYSLGATLYEILTGRVAFEHRSLTELLRQVEWGEFRPPRAIYSQVPPALDAICRKAMAREPKARYASARALADDIETWLADEPTAAYREPWRERLGRWVRRHKTVVTAGAAALLVAVLAGGYFLYDSRLRAIQESTQVIAEARGRVEALRTAEIREVPAIIEQLRPHRALIREHLRLLARVADVEPNDTAQRLRYALAMLPDDTSRVDPLVAHMLRPDCPPAEILVIRQELASHGDAQALTARFWKLLPATTTTRSLSTEQLHAAAALARLDPNNPRWAALAEPLAATLVRENPLHITGWREVFQPPAILALLHNPLRAIYQQSPHVEERALAFTILFELALNPSNATRSAALADLLGDANPDQYRQLIALLDPRDPLAVRHLASKLEMPPGTDLEMVRRQGQIAAALMHFGQAWRIWPLLKSASDPSLRSEIIHDLARFAADPQPLIDQIPLERDPSIRRALIIAVGLFPEPTVAAPPIEAATAPLSAAIGVTPRDVERLRRGESLVREPGVANDQTATTAATTTRAALEATLLKWYRDEPDPGLHGAIAWLLRRQWERGPQLNRLDQELASKAIPRDRDWFVDSLGQTFSIVRGPVEFIMGSPPDEPNQEPDEVQHPRRIDRTFALATREVTTSQFQTYQTDDASDSPPRASERPHAAVACPDCPVVMVDWYQAAQYCNWLSKRAGLPESEWCYPRDLQPGAELAADCLRRPGYRLLTEAEWEFACRADARTSWPHGRNPLLASDHDWLEANAGGVTHAVGSKQPNDLGLFDMLGNASEWCHDRLTINPIGAGPARLDTGDEPATAGTIPRMIRGGSFASGPLANRASRRVREVPLGRSRTLGFRVGRTIP